MCPESQGGAVQTTRATYSSYITTRSTSTAARVRLAWSIINEITKSKGARGLAACGHTRTGRAPGSPKNPCNTIPWGAGGPGGNMRKTPVS
jgi:hypothetical protein